MKCLIRYYESTMASCFHDHYPLISVNVSKRIDCERAIVLR